MSIAGNREMETEWKTHLQYLCRARSGETGAAPLKRGLQRHPFGDIQIISLCFFYVKIGMSEWGHGFIAGTWCNIQPTFSV